MVRLGAHPGGPGVGSAVESVPGALEQGYSGAAAGAEAWRNQADRFQLRQVRLIGGAHTPARHGGQRAAEFPYTSPSLLCGRDTETTDFLPPPWHCLTRLTLPSKQ